VNSVTRQQREECAAVWRERIEDLKASHMPVAVWGAANGVSEAQVCYWLAKFRAQAASSTAKRFVPATVVEADEDGPPALVLGVGAVALEVHPGCDMELLLRRIVRTLVSA